MHLYKGLLEIPLFSQAPRGLVRMLSLQVRPVYVGPGEYLLMQKDVVNCIYFIASGSMEVLQGESVAAILGKGDLFGEDISRKIPIRRSNGDVRALTYCDIYYITRDLLQEVLHLYPDFAYKFSEKLELTYDLGASERDIWRRGGLDSISEDEEEEIEEETSDSPETGSDANNFSIKFPVRNRFAKRMNHFNANEPWKMYSRQQYQRHNRFDLNENQPLLTSPEDTVVPVSDVKILQPSNRQISFDTNSKDQNDVSENVKDNVECDSNLEWEQETFTLKEEEDEGGHDPGQLVTKLSINDITSSRNSIKSRSNITIDEDSEDCNQHTGPETSYRVAKESFLKHLRLGTDEQDHDEGLGYYQQNPRNKSDYDDSYRRSMVNDDDNSDDDRDDQIGFTEFTTPVHGGSSRHLTRSPILVSPTHSLNYSSSKTRIARNILRRDHSDSALLENPLMGTRSGFDKHLPRFYSGEQGGQEKYINSSEALRDHQINEYSLSPNHSIHKDNSRHSLCPSPTPEGSYVGIKGLFATLTPPEDCEYSSNGDLSYQRVPSRSESSRFSDSGRSPRNSLRRNMTSNLNSPASSCGGLNDEKDRPPPSRRRKMSTANAPPPSLFANLVAQACKSPYADFVPPKIVRESTITCNCEEEESCDACGDKDSLRSSPNGNLSSQEDFIMGDFEYGREFQERLELSASKKERIPSPFIVDMNENYEAHEELNAPGPLHLLFRSTPNGIQNETNPLHNGGFNSYSDRRKRPMMTRDAAVYSSASQVDESEFLDSPADSPRLPTRSQTFQTENDCSSKEKNDNNLLGCTTEPRVEESEITIRNVIHERAYNLSPKQTALNLEGKKETSDVPLFFDEVICEDIKQDSIGHSSIGSKANHSSLSSLSSAPSQSFGVRTSATNLRRGLISSSSSNIDINLLNHYSDSERSYLAQNPKISGIHLTQSLGEISHSRRTLDINARTMRNGFSEPYLESQGRCSTRLDNEEGILSEMQFEDIFKDVANTKQAMERLQMILSSPDPNMSSDLADTKETMKRLDEQVLHLNRDVASLRGDVKMVLELLRGLKNGQTVYP